MDFTVLPLQLLTDYTYNIYCNIEMHIVHGFPLVGLQLLSKIEDEIHKAGHQSVWFLLILYKFYIDYMYFTLHSKLKYMFYATKLNQDFKCV